MEIWGHSHLTHEFLQEYQILPSELAFQHKMEYHQGQYAFYFFSIRTSIEFGSLPETKKEQRKVLNKLKKLYQ